MKELIKIAHDMLPGQNFDHLAVGVIDFNSNDIQTFEINSDLCVTNGSNYFFDLASLSKPLTLASTYLKDPSKFSNEMSLLLNHNAGLPIWGLLSENGWREQILNYKIKKSPVAYSDFSALRLMLEIEEVYKKPHREVCSYFWDTELCHWLDLKKDVNCPITGTRAGDIISGVVHDPNAWVIGKFCSHAGMFGTVNGVSKSLLNLNKETDFINVMKKDFKKFKKEDRFLNGFDTVSDLANTLAGSGCGENTFGHLGFTGTSFWIDTDRGIGSVILTNGTRDFWYNREGLNGLRRALGAQIWKK